MAISAVMVLMHPGLVPHTHPHGGGEPLLSVTTGAALILVAGTAALYLWRRRRGRLT